MKKEQKYFVYILEMANGNYYTGYTNDLKQRFQAHLEGKGAKFTRAFKPEKILCAWRIKGSRGAAMQVEAFIKKQTKSLKSEIIVRPGKLKKLFFKDKTESICEISLRKLSL